MTHRLALVLIAFLSATGVAAQANEAKPETGAEKSENTPKLVRDGRDARLEDFLWVNRLIVVFADTDRDPRFAQQMELIDAQPNALLERDVIVFTDTDPAAKSALRQKLRPRGFMMALIGKDGTVYFRKPLPWSVREISASIDKNPLRQQEIRDRRAEP